MEIDNFLLHFSTIFHDKFAALYLHKSPYRTWRIRQNNDLISSMCYTKKFHTGPSILYDSFSAVEIPKAAIKLLQNVGLLK